MAENKYMGNGCKDAVCVDAGRVYDSCSDKDCLEDTRVYFTERDQMAVDHAVGVRAKKAEVLTTCIDVEAMPYNRGYYSCDLTFFFSIELELYGGRGTAGCTTVTGVGIFQKKVILYGSEGSVKVFASEFSADRNDRQEMPTRNMPRCCVQVAEPVILSSRLVEACQCQVCAPAVSSIPSSLCERFGGNFVDCGTEKIVLVTLGLFTIVQLIRNVQMLVPVYDFCLPTKECCPNTETPCELFRKMNFPVDEFFPPLNAPTGCG